VALRILDFGGTEVDTRSHMGLMLLTMFPAVAEFDPAIMLERRRAGVPRARPEGNIRAARPPPCERVVR
jgi:DNA invertase Pin-like site-specific DNA recombinase